MRKILFAAFLFCFIQAYAKTPEVPDELLNAKTAYVKNEGAQPKDIEKFIKLLTEWGRFELVKNPESADILITLNTQLQYRTVRMPSTSGGLGGINTQQVLISYIKIFKAKDSTTLWSDETMDTKDPKYLVDNLKSKMKKKEKDKEKDKEKNK